MASQFVRFRTKSPNPGVPGVEDIDPREVWEQRSNLALIDVRRPDEYTGELGHAPGANLIVLDNLPQQITELPKDRSIVFICRSGSRSASAAAFAKENGFDQVFNMKGGMLLWNELGLETENE